jgi:glycosyltransferase involved in cell wall biosynthesis
MKVGIYLSDLDPKLGGGYTFQNDIFQALIQISGWTSHTFVMIGNFPESSTIIGSGGQIESQPEIELVPYRLGLLEKIVRRSLNLDYSLYKIWQKISKLEQIIQNHQIDFLWFVSTGFIPVSAPFAVSVWDLQHRRQPWFPEVSSNGQWDIRENYHGRMLRSAAMVITGTETGKKEVEYFYQVHPNNIKVVPFATPSFALDDQINPTIPVFSDSIPQDFLFYPAQFWAHKNHIGLLLAVQDLRDRYHLNFPVVFVGSDKGNQPYIEQVVKNLNLEPVYFLGFVNQAQLVWLYRHAFALVFPTLFGPDNLPPLEAFALGCPVIASKVSGAEEQLGNSAWLVDPTKPEEIALAIKSLWENSELRQSFIDRGLIKAREWTAIDYVKNICQILDDFAAIRQCWNHSKTLPAVIKPHTETTKPQAKLIEPHQPII